MDSAVLSRFKPAAPVHVPTEEVIYCDRHKLFLKSKGKEDRIKFLNITVSLMTLISPFSEKSVAVKITDDDDPFVYYLLIVKPEDFWSMKHHQGLLIDYDKFAQQLIKLFDLCKHSDVSPSNYHLVVEESIPDLFGSCKITLKVIEANQFKQLCHFSLDINTGTEDEMKRHLALQISMMKDSLTQAEARASQGELRIQEVVKQLEAKTKELEDIQVRWREESNNYHQQARQELTAERDNFMKIQLDLKDSFESEKKHLQDMLDEKKKSFDELQAENKKLFEKICELESKLRETSQQLTNAQEEICVLHKDKEKLRTQGSKLDADYHGKEKSLNILKTKLAVHEQELRDKNALLDQQKKLLQVAQEQKAFFKHNVAVRDESLQKKQTSLSALSQELCKSNGVIQKLSKEKCSLKSELKRRTAVISKQEHHLSSKEKELVELKAKVEDCAKIINTLELSEQKLKQDLEAAETKIKEKDITVTKNSDLINWLNHRINEIQTFAAKETDKEQKLPTSVVTHTSTPHLPPYPQTKRVFETTGSSGDYHISNIENSVIQKTDATASEPLVVTTQSGHFISSYHAFLAKRSSESHERGGVTGASAATINPSSEQQFQVIRPHVPKESNNDSSSNQDKNMQKKKKTSSFQYYVHH